MQRFLPAAAIVALVALLAAGAVWLAVDDGPVAFSVAGHEVSQHSVDEELKELVENNALQAAIAQGGGQQWSNQPGSAASEVAAKWVGLRIAQRIAPVEVRRRGLSITDADRRRGREIARRSLPGGQLSALPQWLRERLLRRWTRVAVLERDLVDNPTSALDDVIAASCPSGRYVAHIAVATAEEASAIQALLASGSDFAELAKARSIDAGSATAGGNLGCLDALQGRVDQAFLDVATSQPIGVVSAPVQTDFGFHLILVTDQPSGADLNDLRVSAVLRELTRGKRVELNARYGTWDKKNGQVLPPVAPTD